MPVPPRAAGPSAIKGAIAKVDLPAQPVAGLSTKAPRTDIPLGQVPPSGTAEDAAATAKPLAGTGYIEVRQPAPSPTAAANDAATKIDPAWNDIAAQAYSLGGASRVAPDGTLLMPDRKTPK